LRLAPVRLVFFLFTAAFAAAAVWPEAAITPIRSLVAQMREPEQAVPVARAFFIGSAVLLGMAGAGWPRIVAATAAAVGRVCAWPARRFWFVAAAVAVVLRGAAALLPYEPTSDAAWYHAVAVSLAHGEGLSFAGEPTAFRSPAYPFVLSLLYRAGGEHVALAWVIGMLATAGLMVAIHRIAMHLHGESVARVATLGVATYPALVLMTGQAMSDLPFLAGLFALWAWGLGRDGERPRDAAFAGIALGALTLLRTVAAGLVVFVPLLIGSRHRIRAMAITLCIAAACVLPWMIRNAVALDSFTIGTNGGSNLLVGNRPGASGWRDAFDLPASVQRATGEVARDEAMRAEALHFIRDHPFDALAILPGKLAGMYLLETQAVSSLFQGARHGSDAVRDALYGVCQFAWLAIALLVVARIVSWRDPAARPRDGEWAGWLLVGYFTAICLVFHGEDRYRLPLLPWFLIEAAVVIAAAGQPRRRSMSPLSSSSEAN
jgi:4-amino-4-deoxy-L-arabinose transferase-like glycosyltransferase